MWQKAQVDLGIPSARRRGCFAVEVGWLASGRYIREYAGTILRKDAVGKRGLIVTGNEKYNIIGYEATA